MHDKSMSGKRRASSHSAQGFFQNETNVRFILEFIDSPYDLIVFRRVSKLFNTLISDSILPAVCRTMCGIDIDNRAFVEFLKNRTVQLSDFNIHVIFEKRPDLTMKIQYDNKLNKCEQLYTVPGTTAVEFLKKLDGFDGEVHFNIILNHRRRKYLRRARASHFHLANYDLVLDSPLYFCEHNSCRGECKKTTFRLSHLLEDDHFAFYLFSEGNLWKKNQVLHRFKEMFGIPQLPDTPLSRIRHSY